MWPEVTTRLGTFFIVFVLIALGNGALWIGRFHTRSRGYLWPAFQKGAGLILLSFAGEALVVSALLALVALTRMAIPTGSLSYVLVPLAIAYDNWLGWLSARPPLVRLERRWFQRALVLRATHQFRIAIQVLKETDNYDWPEGNGYFAIDGVRPEEIGRRMRVLYERCKVRIANERRQPGLLDFSEGHPPEQKFYVLVEHLGRRELRERLKQPPVPLPPERTWDGQERRRTSGSNADRRQQHDDAAASRASDDKKLRRLVARGEAYADDCSATASAE